MWVRKMMVLMIILLSTWLLVTQTPLRAATLPQSFSTGPSQSQAVPTPPELEPKDVSAFLDGLVPAMIRQADIAGAVIMVVRDGQIVVQKGYGFADVRRRKPVDPQTTIVRPGSIAKTFAFTALLQLVEAGKVGLDDDVNKYIDFRIPSREGQPVTIRNLMTHTPGFEEALTHLGTNDPKKLLSAEAYLKSWIPDRIYAPGTTPAYSNYGATLAGYIVQRVSGEPFEKYIEHHILNPLGMKYSTFRQPLPANLQPFMSESYDLGSGPPAPYDLIGVAPAGALASSGGDMAKYMIAQLAGDVLLKPETTKAMFATTLPIFPRLNPVALGFFRRDMNGQLIVEHSGDSMTFHSMMFLLPESRTGVFLSFNSTGRNYATSGAREEIFQAFVNRYYPAASGKHTFVPKAVAAEHAAMMAGTYMISRRSQSSFLKALQLVSQDRVTISEGSISGRFLEGPGGQLQKWDEIAPFVWKDRDSPFLLAAEVKDGKVTRFGVDPYAGQIIYLRVPWYESSAWLRPALMGSVVILMLTILGWIGSVAARRYYHTEPRYRIKREMPWVTVRISSITAVGALFGWAVLLPNMMANITKLDGRHDPLIRALQLVGAISFIALFAGSVWNLFVNWRSSPWTARVWNLALVAASVIIIWVAVAFNLVITSTSF
jgi:CubicO group peptidase (beta-lactamase class C family)